MNAGCVPRDRRERSDRRDRRDRGNARRTARGRTLVELMIAIALSLGILLAISAIYLGARQNTRSVDQNAALQDAGRAALAAIGREMRQAGWSPIVGGAGQQAGRRLSNTGVVPVEACRGGYTTPTDLAAGGCTGDTGSPDAFTVRYSRDTGNISGDVDCAGASGAFTSTLAVNRFYIATNPNSGQRELFCRGSSSAAEVAYLDNVRDMRLFIGLDTDADFDGVADTWVRADAVTSTQFRLSAVAVRVCLIVASTEAGIATADFTYADCEGNTVQPNDGVMRRAFWGTFGLRNNLTRF